MRARSGIAAVRQGLVELPSIVVDRKVEPGVEEDRSTQQPFPKLDRTAFAVVPLFEEPDEKAYWLSRTGQERLRHIEMLRRINYGSRATSRLQRVLELAEHPRR
jgi:hypothetical protein